jgi:hypothetical protein
MSRAHVCLAILLMGVSVAASANPIPITSGFIFLAPQSAHDADFQLSGPGFVFGASEVEDQPIVVPPAPGLPRTGTSIDLSAYTVIGQNDGGFPARGTFDGTPVKVQGPMWLRAAETFLRCGSTPSAPLLCDADAPFALSAALSVADAATGAPLFTRPFAGSGRVHGVLWNDGINVENHLSLQYILGPAPVPEPGTLVLLASGICGVWARSGRRRPAA